MGKKRTSLLLRDVCLPLVRRYGPEDDVHLLQTPALRFGNEQGKCKHGADVDRGEHEEDLVTQVRNYARRGVRDYEVP